LRCDGRAGAVTDTRRRAPWRLGSGDRMRRRGRNAEGTRSSGTGRSLGRFCLGQAAVENRLGYQPQPLMAQPDRGSARTVGRRQANRLTISHVDCAREAGSTRRPCFGGRRHRRICRVLECVGIARNRGDSYGSGEDRFGMGNANANRHRLAHA
jgi:hypothetical protein